MNYGIKDFTEEMAQKYQTNEPFPHIVIDNFMDEAILSDISNDFPDLYNLPGEAYKTRLERKKISQKQEFFSNTTNEVIRYLNSEPFLRQLEFLTGIERPLIADKGIIGGGLHQTKRGGLLKIHTDFNKHPFHKWDRRLNILIYLNKDWQDEWGGAVELWDKDMKECKVKVMPRFNTCVIFSTSEISFHGHPDPLTCPEDVSRKSLALYYYTDGRPEETELHSTYFRSRGKADEEDFEGKTDHQT